MDTNLVYTGVRFRIEFAVLVDGSMPAKTFFLEQMPQNQAKMMALFKRLGDAGVIKNHEHFKKLSGDFFEFKSFQIRMPCYFLPGRRVVITHGFIKKKDAVDKQQLERAANIKTQCDGRKKGK